MTPDDGKSAAPERTPPRRTVRLAADVEPESAAVPAPRGPATHTLRPTLHPALRERVLRVVELAVGDWAPTLREALVRVVVFAVLLVALGLVLGVGVAAAGAAVGLVMFLIGRRRSGPRG